MLVNLTIVSKADKPDVNKLFEGVVGKEWQVVKIHEIENIVLTEAGEK
jgi:hypothetical protein